MKKVLIILGIVLCVSSSGLMAPPKKEQGQPIKKDETINPTNNNGDAKPEPVGDGEQQQTTETPTPDEESPSDGGNNDPEDKKCSTTEFLKKHKIPVIFGTTGAAFVSAIILYHNKDAVISGAKNVKEWVKKLVGKGAKKEFDEEFAA